MAASIVSDRRRVGHRLSLSKRLSFRRRVPDLPEELVAVTKVSCADGFVERATGCGFNAYRYVGEHLRQGQSGLTCDGKAMALSRAFIEALTFPTDARALANVDGYIYLACVQHGFAYRYAGDAALHFRAPATLADFLKWQSRNYARR